MLQRCVPESVAGCMQQKTILNDSLFISPLLYSLLWRPLALSSAFKICVLCIIIRRWMAVSSSDMYNKQMLITFKTYFMVMQIFMEANCIIANFPQAHWREKVWLHSAQMISAICNRSKNTLLLISQVRLFLSKRYFIMIINTWSAGRCKGHLFCYKWVNALMDR